MPACFRHAGHYTTTLYNVEELNLARNEIGPNVEEYSLAGLRYTVNSLLDYIGSVELSIYQAFPNH